MTNREAETVRVIIVTVSDTRDETTDESGYLIKNAVEQAGFVVEKRVVVRDEIAHLREILETGCEGSADAMIFTGGTGIAPRDVTIEALEPLFEKTLPGFGEAFRRLSWDQVGYKSVLSRAIAGTKNGKVIFVLPGSKKAVQLALEQLILPLLPHSVDLASGRNTTHRKPNDK